MSKFISQILKESKKYGINLYAEAAEEEQADPNAQTEDASTGEQQNPNAQDQDATQQAPQAESDPFPERFVYLAGLLQKALQDKFPSIMNIEPINQENAAQAIQNMEGLMKQAGMLDDINTKNVNI